MASGIAAFGRTSRMVNQPIPSPRNRRVTILVALPLGVYFLRHPESFTGRAGTGSVFADDASLSAFGASLIKTLGMFNVFGETLDGKGEVKGEARRSIHRQPVPLVQQSAQREMSPIVAGLEL